jgi:hypothetical protein
MYTLLVTGDVPGASTYFNPLLQQSIIPCTSGTRPASPGDGWTIYETDTKRVVQYSTSLVAWTPTGGTAVWSSYSPAWTATTTNPTLGNGTLTGAYMEMGQTVQVRIVLTVGSTTSVGSGVYSFSLPFGGKLNGLMSAMFSDASAGAALTPGVCRIVNTTSTGDNMRVSMAGQTLPLGATVPVVPATGDVAIISGSYEKN